MKFKKTAAAVLAAIMAVGTMSVVSFASPAPDSEEETEGNWQYKVNEDGETVMLSKYNGTDTEVVIPATLGGKSVTAIGFNAFDECMSRLESITIPDSVTEIYNNFFGWKSIEKIEVSNTNSNYCSVDGVLFNKDKTKLIGYPAGKKETSYTIPNSVTEICSTAFANCKLESVTIPDSVTDIEVEAFSGSNLKSVTIPGSVMRIQTAAFAYCMSLESVTISAGVKLINIHVFDNCISLKTVNFIGTKEEWEAMLIGVGNGCLTNAEITYSTPTTSKPAESTVTPGDSDKQETLEATLKNVDSEKGIEGAALDKLIFGETGWTWNEVERVEFTSDKLFSVQFAVDNDGWKTLGEEAARAETDGKWSTEWTLNASEMAKDKKYAKVIAKEGTTDVTAKVYIKKGAEKPASGEDQKPTGITLAIAPVVLAASAAVVALSKKKK